MVQRGKLMKNYKSTKFVRVNSVSSQPEWEHVFPVAIPDNLQYPEIVNWDKLTKFVKTLSLDTLPVVIYHNECPYDGECHHCSHCCDQAGDEYEVLIPVYSYTLSWEQNRRLLSAFCDAWGETDLAGVYAFVQYHRKSLNKTCGRGWTDRLVRRIRREYFSAF